MSTSSITHWLALPALLLAGATAPAATVFTTWTSVDLPNDTATGSLGAVTITLAGTGANPVDLSFYEANSNRFTSGAFSVPVADVDALEFRGSLAPARQLTLSFSSPVLNPIVHLASVASVITFTGGVSSITRVPGILGNNTNFSVSGLIVSAADNLTDSDGTIRLDGLVSAVTFTTELTAPFTVDGMFLQIGADAAAVPAPGAFVLLLTALVAAATRRMQLKATSRPHFR